MIAHPDYPAWTFVAMIMILLPLPWHWRARNVATLALIFWIFLDNLLVFVNASLWANDFIDRSPIWCDISGRGLLIVPCAVSVCSALQMRRLESVASTRRSVVSASERTRRLWLECVLGFGLPLLMLPLLYLVQGHRYNITDTIGCIIPTHPAWPGIFLRYFFPMLISLISMLYSALAVRWFVVRRMQFRAILAASNSGLNISRYLRLIALAVTLNVILIANDILLIVVTLNSGIERNLNLSELHTAFNVISYYPESLQVPVHMAIQILQVYIGPIYALVFFIFFGLSEEAIGEYVGLLKKAQELLGRFGLVPKHNGNEKEMSLPKLGSRVVPAGPGVTWTANHHTRSRTSNDHVEAGGDEKLFDGTTSASTGVQSAPHSGSGIPVLVERSIV